MYHNLDCDTFCRLASIMDCIFGLLLYYVLMKKNFHLLVWSEYFHGGIHDSSFTKKLLEKNWSCTVTFCIICSATLSIRWVPNNLSRFYQSCVMRFYVSYFYLNLKNTLVEKSCSTKSKICLRYVSTVNPWFLFILNTFYVICWTLCSGFVPLGTKFIYLFFNWEK